MPPTRVLKGDWTCECGEKNFASRHRCRRCSKDKPGLKEGEWVCIGCAKLNFRGRTTCFSCTADKNGEFSTLPPPKPVDWTCECGEKIFASKYRCRRCGKDRPGLKEGEWVCSNCARRNFRGRTVCFFCDLDKDSATSPVPLPEPEKWKCLVCLFSNFASRDKCFRCHLQRDSPADTVPNLVDGEWQCSCRTVNSAVSARCFVCKIDRPKNEEEKLAMVKISGECVVCMSSPADVLLMPCGHISSCGKCSSRLDKCPLCKSDITKQMRVYVSGIKES